MADGHNAPRAAKPRPPLSLALILEEAVALIDSEGLARSTMRDLAARLGCTDMALYRYVASRGELHDAIIDMLLDRISLPADAGLRWDERLNVAYSSLFRIYREHPQMLPALLNRPLALRSIGRGLSEARAMLAACGFDEQQASGIMAALSAYTLGYATLICGGFFTQARPAEHKGSRARRRPLGSDCPGLPAEADWQAYEQRFDRGLGALLAGLRQQYERPSAPSY